MSQKTSIPTVLNLESALGHEIVDRRLQILRQVHALGSISGAAREVGVSYKAAWQALDTLGNLAGQAVVQASLGGSGGGGAKLTVAGTALLQAYDALRSARQMVLSSLNLTSQVSQASMTPNPSIGTEFALFGWRTSMRNQLPCVVEEVTDQKSICTVRLCLPDQQSLYSRITSYSAQLLALMPGMPVIAMFKATAVKIIARDKQVDNHNDVKTGLVSYLQGRVVNEQQESMEIDSEEVTIELGQGQRVVGMQTLPAFFAQKQLQTSNQDVLAQLDASAVVLVLPA